VNDDILTFQRYRTLSGSIQAVDVYRRNGRRAANFRPAAADAPAADAPDVFSEYRDLLAANLTPIEERTWRGLLGGRSISSIAEEEGVKRAAIYARIRGSGGTGGMVRKNPWVARWWRRRQTECL
jgi:hypothetical protein